MWGVHFTQGGDQMGVVYDYSVDGYSRTSELQTPQLRAVQLSELQI